MDDDFHEIWWIFSPSEKEWGGLRIAHFSKAYPNTLIAFIQGEIDRRRIGPRIWEDVAPREGWVKVAQIIRPTKFDIQDALISAERLGNIEAP